MLRIKDNRFVLHKNGDDYAELMITDMSVSGSTKYYGYTGPDNAWVVMRWNTSTNHFDYATGINNNNAEYSFASPSTLAYSDAKAVFG
jgi:hypothetical protein